jgi:hypothetical protein
VVVLVTRETRVDASRQAFPEKKTFGKKARSR